MCRCFLWIISFFSQSRSRLLFSISLSYGYTHVSMFIYINRLCWTHLNFDCFVLCSFFRRSNIKSFLFCWSLDVNFVVGSIDILVVVVFCYLTLSAIKKVCLRSVFFFLFSFVVVGVFIRTKLICCHSFSNTFN